MQQGNDEIAIRVVLADDDEDVRQLVRINLELDGRFEVVGETRDGIETISLIRRSEPDVALVDVDMPRSSGLEAVRRIRNIRPDVRVLVYSASGHDDVAADALAAGAHGYISRTFDITKVGAKIAALCSTGELAVKGAP